MVLQNPLQRKISTATLTKRESRVRDVNFLRDVNVLRDVIIDCATFVGSNHGWCLARFRLNVRVSPQDPFLKTASPLTLCAPYS